MKIPYISSIAASLGLFVCPLLATPTMANSAEATFLIYMDYTCGKYGVKGNFCDGVTVNRTYTGFVASTDLKKPTNLTQQNGGSSQGIFFDFNMAGRGLGKDTVSVTCTNGADILFDPADIFNINGSKFFPRSFGCDTLSIKSVKGNTVGLEISNHTQGGGIISGTIGGQNVVGTSKLSVVKGGTKDDKKYWVTVPGIDHAYVFRDMWKSCQLSGVNFSPTPGLGGGSCDVEKATNQGWILSGSANGRVVTCSMTCTDRLAK